MMSENKEIVFEKSVNYFSDSAEQMIHSVGGDKCTITFARNSVNVKSSLLEVNEDQTFAKQIFRDGDVTVVHEIVGKIDLPLKQMKAFCESFLIKLENLDRKETD